MKLPFTEQFLWDVYRGIEGVSDFYQSTKPKTLGQVLYPELYELRRTYRKKRSAQQFSRLLYDLKRRGFIKVQSKGVMLTQKGKKHTLRIKWKVAKGNIRSDGKMVMVMYDFPEKKRSMRDIFRSILRALGYQEFQLSVWISKNKVEKETEEAIREYDLWSYVRLFVIEEVYI